MVEESKKARLWTETKECGLSLATHTNWDHGGLKMSLQSPVLDL